MLPIATHATWTNPLASVYAEVEGPWGLPAGLAPLAQEYQAAREGLALADLGQFSALELRGPEALEFGQRLLTNDVLALAPGTGCRAFLLNVQGRPVLDTWCHRLDDGLLLLTPREHGRSAHRELDNYLFTEKLRIVDHFQDWTVLGVLGPGRAVELPEGLWRGPLGLYPQATFVTVPNERAGELRGALVQAGATPIGQPCLEVLRVEQGWLRPDEFTEKTMFLELVDESAYSETKGCYPGQEVVARTLHRGHVNRRVRGLQGPQMPPPGTPLLGGEREMGQLLVAVDSPRLGPIGLAILRREVESAVRTPDGLALQVVDLPMA